MNIPNRGMNTIIDQWYTFITMYIGSLPRAPTQSSHAHPIGKATALQYFYARIPEHTHIAYEISLFPNTHTYL